MGERVAVNIRLFRKEDLKDVHRFIRRPEVLRGTLQIPSLQIGQMAARWLGESENRFTLVAEVAKGPSQGRVIGSISLRRGTGRRAHVAGLGMTVDPDFHGQGIGTQMMETALDMADRCWRPIRIELEVYPDNEPAVRLYRKFGFEVEGRKVDVAIREGGYTDSLVMSRLAPLEHRADAPLGRIPPRGTRPDGKLRPCPEAQPPSEAAPKSATEGPSLDVRPPEPGDAAALHRFYCDEGVLRSSMFLPWTVPPVDKIAQDLESEPSKAASHRFIATANGEIYGEVALDPGRSRLARTGRVTLMVLPPASAAARRENAFHCSESVADALLNSLVNLADDWLMLHRLEAETYRDEYWLFPALEGAGFAREATARMACLRDGVYGDRLTWGRTTE
ncbi:MAG: GNAT family N-acetyltransferase [Bacillota bacterium]